MSRDAAIAEAMRYFDEGGFAADLARRIAIPTESQNPERGGELRAYLDTEMRPTLEALGCRCEVLEKACWRSKVLTTSLRVAAALIMRPNHGCLRATQATSRSRPGWWIMALTPR